MKKFFSRLANDDGGEVMIESTIIIFITISLMLTMLSLGFLFYQQAMIKTIANEVAEGIASSYKYSERNDSYHVSQITGEDIISLNKYRTTFNVSAMATEYEVVASEYVRERVALTNLGLNSSEPTIETLEISASSFGRLRVDIVVSLESDFLFSGVLEYMDIIDSTPTFKAGATAECLDITSYTGSVNFQRYLEEKSGDGILGDIDTIVNSAKTIYETIFG